MKPDLQDVLKDKRFKGHVHIADDEGNYDIDGVSQCNDGTVVISSDKKPVQDDKESRVEKLKNQRPENSSSHKSEE
jgi:hypothetical protein